VSNFAQTAAVNGRKFSDFWLLSAVGLGLAALRKPMADRTEELRDTAAHWLGVGAVDT
jgi:hypothetical protein